ncbi:MAG TPA: PilZ domain-containing protein, partial [Pseudobdellovibrionaceae bacterium]|nr:PilZ domain-containing protein [Pseudobdellovibrionaceae bacterium]
MFKGLARFHARSPRYILSPEEDTWIRLAGPHQTPWEEGTEIKDISLTGLSFTAPSDLSPQLGEVIKIQFTPPQSKSIASYAVTTRVEKLSDLENLIAVQYYKMDIKHRVAIAQSLEIRLAERNEKRLKLNSEIFSMDFLAKKEFYLMTLMILIWFS